MLIGNNRSLRNNFGQCIQQLKGSRFNKIRSYVGDRKQLKKGQNNSNWTWTGQVSELAKTQYLRVRINIIRQRRQTHKQRVVRKVESGSKRKKVTKVKGNRAGERESNKKGVTS